MWISRFALTLFFTLITTTLVSVADGEYHAVAHPQNMQRFGCTLPNKAYRLIATSAPMQVFYVDEPVSLTLALQRGETKAFALDIQEITQRVPEEADPNQAGVADFGAPEMMSPEGKPIRHPFAATFTNEPAAKVELGGVPVPAKAGTYALILVCLDDVGKDRSRQFLGTLARVPRDNPAATVHNTWILGEGSFITGDDATRDARGAAYERMGIRGMRCELSTTEQFSEVEKKAKKADPQAVGTYDWKRLDELFGTAAKHKISIMGTLGGHNGDWWPFRVEPTPAANWHDKAWGYGGTGDWVCSPELYPRYGKWITALCERYWLDGKGALWGLENYNEPWEGGGISGWARDMREYREIQKLIASSARKVSDKIVLFAASSVMNTEDKFYSDGSDEMSQYVDIFTDHYVKPPVCYGPLVAAARGKLSMETESWMANAEYRLPLAVLTFLASGQIRINPWHPRDLFDEYPDCLPMPTPVVVATAAMNAMTSGKTYEKIVFRDHLPWVFQFGKDEDPAGLLVVYGQLVSFGSRKPQDNVHERPWAQVEGADGGTITIDNADGLLEFLDIAGNPVLRGEKLVTLPMSFIPTFIRCAKGPAAAAARLAVAKIEGKRPVEILPADFSAPLNSLGAVLNVKIHNCLNRPIQGTLTAKSASVVVLETTSQPVELAAGETKAISFKVKVSAPGVALASRKLIDEANAYPFEFLFESDAGRAEYTELLNAAIAPQAKIVVDGNLDDWKGVPGILLAAKSEKFDATEAARRPWLATAEKQPDGTFAEVKLAWDKNFLYVSARVNDPTPQLDKVRGATRRDDDYFHSAASDSQSPYKEFLETRKIGDKTLKELGYSFAQVPYVYKRVCGDTSWNGDRLQFAFDVADDWHDLQPNTDRAPLGFTAWPDSDYEYSAYLCADGRGELWRLLAPGVPRVHDYPRQPKGKVTTGAVSGAQQVVKQEGNVRTYELAIPQNEIAQLKLQKGNRFGFMFQIGNDRGPGIFYAETKAAAKQNGLTLHPYWMTSPSCGVRWTLTE